MCSSKAVGVGSRSARSRRIAKVQAAQGKSTTACAMTCPVDARMFLFLQRGMRFNDPQSAEEGGRERCTTVTCNNLYRECPRTTRRRISP
eukprot:g13680.t1